MSRPTAFLLVLLFTGVVLQAAPKPKLSTRHQEFLSGPTSLLLTRDERSAFQHLATDDERDNFVSRFWQVRNPTPGLLNNEFKEEFYRRVAYANSFYGKDSGSTRGWRTDRGRAYILFGKPQTSMNYNGNQELYPIELWFYGNPGLSELPPFFYVMFYEGDGVSGYHVFEPAVDGADKLLREGGNSKAQAYRYLRSISPELANATLSYIPGEPVDTTNFNGSMASQAVVNALEGFNEMPSYVSKIRQRSFRLEQVNSKVEYKLARASLLTFPVEQAGKPWVHWRMEVSDPAQPKWKSDSVAFEVQARLYSKGQFVLEQTDKPVLKAPARASADLNQRPLVYQDVLPVEPGKYQLHVEVKNTDTGLSYDASSEFDIPALSKEGVTLSSVLVIERHSPQARPKPFQFAGVEFSPASQNYTAAARGLSIFYQLQLPTERPKELIARYAVGSVSGDSKKTFEEKLDPLSADTYGSLLVAKTLPLQELAAGQYRLSVRVEEPVSHKTVTTALPFTIMNDIPATTPIVISRARSESQDSKAAVEYERALCQLIQDRPAEASASLRASWELSNNAATKLLFEKISHSLLPEAAQKSKP